MKTKCPHCGQHYEVEDCAVGTTVTCENCWKDFTVSDAAAAPPPPAAAKPASEPTISRCPFCGGDITPEAKKCRHCGEWIRKDNRGKIIVLVLTGLVLVALVITGILLVLNRGAALRSPNDKQKSASSPVPVKPKTIRPTIGVKHFAAPAHSATCVLYKNDREIMRKETTHGGVIFMRVECSPNDFFHVEMQYKNGYGTVGQIIKSYSRKATQSSGNVIILEPEWESDREYL